MPFIYLHAKISDMNRIWTMILAAVLLSCVFPAAGQEARDSVYVFRFVTGEDMFFVPWSGNGAELGRLERCVERHKAAILSGEVPVQVEGRCSSQGSEADNLSMARIRSNRVKSELIVRQGLREDCFVTQNRAGGGDVVTVRIGVRKAEEEVGTAEGEEEKGEPVAGVAVSARDSVPAERGRADVVTDGSTVEADSEPVVEVDALLDGAGEDARFSLRANLLRWATLTPDLGVEWRVNGAWGVVVDGTWTSWSWQDAGRRYALWEVAPAVHYYIGEGKRGYVGAMFKAGQFNYKLSDTGKQGDLLGGGLRGGYRLALSRALALDFGVGVGCLHAEYEEYGVMKGVRVRSGEGSRWCWGVMEVGVRLVWGVR